MSGNLGISLVEGLYEFVEYESSATERSLAQPLFTWRCGNGNWMRALKLVQHMKTNASRMSDTVLQKIRASDRCRELLARVPVEEHQRYALNIYSELTAWLESQSDSSIEEHYVALGIRRAQQRVPFSDLFWAVCIANEYLWEYMQEECLIEEPVEFWGGRQLLRALNQFFDRALYFASIGYQESGKTLILENHL
jgi:hypothetical protein